MKDRTVPVFHLSDLKRGLRQEELRKCLAEKGVFYLEEDGPLKSAHHLAQEAAMSFFEHGSEEAKRSVTNSQLNIRRGFSALESESTAQSTNTGDYSDYAMVYSMGVAHNLFPSSHFEEVWAKYFELYYRVSQETARAVLEPVNLQCYGGFDSFVDCDPVLRFRYFPEVPEDRCAERQPRRMAPHYDLSIISVILQTPCPNGFVSLQVEVEGEFVDLPPISDCLVVMCGSVATLVSNGKIKAPKHQVVSPGLAQRMGSSRKSSVFFLRPKPQFTFSIPLARACGLDVELAGEKATFKEWMGANYLEMHAKKTAS